MIYNLIDNVIKKDLEKENIIFERANIKDINNIIGLYEERIQWFKQNNIKQWSKYLINHPKEQFKQVIENGDYYILRKNNKIIAGFEISTDSHIWNDNISNAYYLYKVVTKVGSKNIGSIIFKIAKNITKINGKYYLRTEHIASNIKLNEIYEKNGFKFIKEGQDYYHYILREYKVKE